MALKANDKTKLTTVLAAGGIDVDKLIAAIVDPAEVDFAVPEDITVLKNTDLEARDANVKTTAKKEGETEGEKKGRELAAKQFKRKMNLPETVPNDVDKIAEAATEQLGKGDAGLTEQVKLLQKDKQELENKVLLSEQKANQATFDASLIASFPANRTADLNDGERLALVKMNLEFAEENGVQIVKRNGEVLRDATTKAPLPVKTAITTLFAEKNWVPKTPGPGGRGGGDNPPGGGGGAAGLKKASQFQEKWKAENPDLNENGAEYMDALAAHAKDIPDFAWHE